MAGEPASTIVRPKSISRRWLAWFRGKDPGGTVVSGRVHPSELKPPISTTALWPLPRLSSIDEPRRCKRAGLFVPNDGNQGIWLSWASDGKRRQLPVNQHLSIEVPQSLAMAVGRENVPTCVRIGSLGLRPFPLTHSAMPNDRRPTRLALGRLTDPMGGCIPTPGASADRSERLDRLPMHHVQVFRR